MREQTVIRAQSVTTATQHWAQCTRLINTLKFTVHQVNNKQNFNRTAASVRLYKAPSGIPDLLGCTFLTEQTKTNTFQGEP